MKTIDLQTEQQTAVALTRKEKLLRWAELVMKQPHNLPIFHGLEYWNDDMLTRPMCANFGPNVFSLANADPVFKAAGLKGDSVRDSMEFFELTQDELHEFSCDCGGAITNTMMSDRITSIAEGRSHNDRAMTARNAFVDFVPAPRLFRRILNHRT